MSQTFDSSTVINPVSFVLTASGPTPQVQPLYTLSGIYNERIESIWMQLPYAGNVPTDELFTVQLVAPNGDPIFEQACPPITLTDMSTLTVTLVWSRLGNDTSQAPMLIVDDMVSGYSLGYANMRLPELVLAPLSTVQLLGYRGESGSEFDMTVTNATVTTTRSEDQASTTTQVAGIPLLTDVSSG